MRAKEIYGDTAKWWQNDARYQVLRVHKSQIPVTDF